MLATTIDFNLALQGVKILLQAKYQIHVLVQYLGQSTRTLIPFTLTKVCSLSGANILCKRGMF